MMFENELLNPKSKAETTMQPVKQNIIALRTPSAFETHPEAKPPLSPPAPSNIMAMPRSFWPSVAPSKLCTHVGIQENIPHKPISIDPKMIEPFIKLVLSWPVAPLA